MRVPGKFYPKACPEQMARKLEALAHVLRETGWAERGGCLLRDADGDVTGRTKWIPRAQWWAERPFPFNEKQCAGIVQKTLAGKMLTPSESTCMQHLLARAFELLDVPELPDNDHSWLEEDSELPAIGHGSARIAAQCKEKVT